MQRAAKNEYGPGQPGWAELEHARACFESAESLFDKRAPEPALVLLHSIANALIASALHRAGTDPTELTQEQRWAAFEALAKFDEVLKTLPDGERVQAGAALGAPAASLAELPRQEREVAAGAALRWATRVYGRSRREVGSVAHFKKVRIARIAVTALLLVFVLSLIEKSVVAARRGPNLAAGRSVTVSSDHKKAGRPPKGLVDGKKDVYGFCTEDTTKPWVEIDLGKPRTIRRVVVFNRYDCCEDRALPLTIEVSTDRIGYQRVAQIVDPFEVRELVFLPRPARYVRLIVRGPKTILHLNEVEIY